MLPGLSATTGLGPISYPGVTIHTVTHLPPVPNSGPSLSFPPAPQEGAGGSISSRSTELSSLCYTAASHSLSILHMAV